MIRFCLVLRVYLVATFVFVSSASAFGQEVVLKPGERVDLFPVYWIQNCKSVLNRFLGAEVLQGPAQVEATLTEQPVTARRQGCAEKVPGAILGLTIADDANSYEGTIRIRVKYKTEDGDKQSVHPIKLLIVAPAR